MWILFPNAASVPSQQRRKPPPPLWIAVVVTGVRRPAVQAAPTAANTSSVVAAPRQQHMHWLPTMSVRSDLTSRSCLTKRMNPKSPDFARYVVSGESEKTIG